MSIRWKQKRQETHEKDEAFLERIRPKAIIQSQKHAHTRLLDEYFNRNLFKNINKNMRQDEREKLAQNLRDVLLSSKIL